jgi:hypothetical protein
MSKSKSISVKKKWVNQDGWRGYYEPIYFVAGCNDTGTWDDSPCPSGVATHELGFVKRLLKQAKIKYREIPCETSNVFCIHRYIVVSENDFDTAKEIINKEYDESLKENTNLLYVNK